MDSLRLQIFQTTHSITTAKHRFSIIASILEEVIFSVTDDMVAESSSLSKEDRYTAAIATIESTADREAISKWGTEWLKNITANNVRAQIDSVEAWFASLPVLKLYVPKAFDDEAHKVVGTWCRKELGDMYMVDTEVDGAMIGGCGFIKNDVFYEYSLTSYLDADREVILDVFKEYGTT